jgi:hypothetical protein
MNLRTIAVFLAASAALLGFAMPAAAQIQALALIESDGPVRLTCRGRDCWAEFSSFCLEPDKRSPTRDTAYSLAGVQDVRLVGTKADGSRVVLDADKDLEISALRTHLAVRLSVARSRLNELDLESVAVTGGAKVALLPAPVAGEASRSAADVALVTGELRQAGHRIVDENAEGMPAARLLSRLINALPPGGRVQASVRDSLWRRTIRPRDLAEAPASSRRLLEATYAYCADGAELSVHPSLRSCLESKHDSIVGKLNDTYWKAVETGS